MRARPAGRRTGAMRIWKQAVVSVVVLAAAVVLWARYFPQASGILQRAGIATAAIEADSAGAGGPGFGGPGARRWCARPGRRGDGQRQGLGDRRRAGRAVGDGDASGRRAGGSIEVASGDFVRTGAALVGSTPKSRRSRSTRRGWCSRTRSRRWRAPRSSALERSLRGALRAAELARAGRARARDAELALERRVVRAPFDGWVGILGVDVGDQVDDLDAGRHPRRPLEHPRRLPHARALRRAVGVGAPVTARPLARPGSSSRRGRHPRQPHQPDTRTLRVRASFDNAEDRLRAGMAFSIGMRFPGDTFAAVDPLAIQWSADGAYVWTGADGGAAQVPVRIVQRNNDAVLVDAALAPGHAGGDPGRAAAARGRALPLRGRGGRRGRATDAGPPGRGAEGMASRADLGGTAAGSPRSSCAGRSSRSCSTA